MSLRVCFIGLRHGHIFSLYRLLAEREDMEIAGVCEEDAEARASLESEGVTVTHERYEDMLADVECDVIACGDYYAIRGERLLAALAAGRHVIGDKPLCTRLSELEQIEQRAKQKDLRVGCMLDLTASAPFQTLGRLLREGAIGEVHTIHFDGQHPLNYGSRPGWYFEEGKHGGTINDLAIHGFDAIPWLTGRTIVEVTAARAWNARLRECPFFQDGAVAMLRLDNGGVVTGDVSYLTPEGHGYAMPSYWRFCVSGAEGYAETSCKVDSVSVFPKERDAFKQSLDPGRPGAYFEDFLQDVAGTPTPNGLDTARVLRSARVALLAQHAADTGTSGLPVE